MTTFTLIGTNTGFFGDAFFRNNDSFEIDILFASSTTVIATNPDTGITTTVTGSGFAFSSAQEPIAGTVTGLSMSSANGTVLEGTVTGINWDFVTLVAALDAVTSDNLQPIANLLNAGGPITVDASMAQGGLDMFELLDFDLVPLITQPVTIRGSGFFDELFGGVGNDFIDAGADNGGFDGDNIEITLGNDTIDFSGVSSTSFQGLDFEDFVDGAVTFNVDAVANTGTVTGTGFTTTLIDPRRIMEADGLGLEGSEVNDVFNVTNTADGWFDLRGNEGNDTFNLTLNSGARLSYHQGSFTTPASGVPSAGLIVDLSTGIVSNDGFGGQDTINILGGDGRLEIRATDNNDSITGSDRNESFITEQGDDTVNGGGGFDRVRYDRSGVDAVNVDLGAGTATGTWDGIGFTDTLISIEHIRGSRQGDDTLTGSGADEQLEGRGGDDSIIGGAGNDRLEGDEGNDTLRGGDGRDTLYGDDGNDLLDASGGDASTQGFGDFIRAGLGNDTILGHAGHWAEGEGADISYANIGGIGGLTITSGLNGTGTVVSGDGRVNDTFTFIHYFQGSQDADMITGAAENRWEGFEGNAGNDTIDGGGGDAQVGYNNEHYEGGTSGITANLGSGNQATAVGTVLDTFGNTDTLLQINQVQGSVFNDFIDAAGRIDNIRLEGNDGNDTLQGGQGNDEFLGGDGTDTAIIFADVNSITVTTTGNGLDVQSSQGFDFIEDTVEIIQFNNGSSLTFAQLQALASGGDIFGDENDNNLVGGAADDRIVGLAGNDTLNGGGGENQLEGGLGDDLFIVSSESFFDFIITGLGNDTVDLTNATSFADIAVQEGTGPATITVDVVNDIFNIVNGTDGTTTVLGGRSVIIAPEGGMFVLGGSGNDTFNITQADNGFLGLLGTEGDDTFNLLNGTGGTIRLDYRDGAATNGIVADLNTGIIQDGYGDQDTITGLENLTELRGSQLSDSITGSDRDERFILERGMDTLDAGEGFDLLRYDRNQVEAVTVDLEAGTASGVWRGEAFTHSFTGVEAVRGSRDDNDTLMSGNGIDALLDGRGGNDRLVGANGNDTLLG
ncbi:calcium-binding protein, partial [Tateyamaria sp. ANG-S1]|uniref:beta strand repeat-containing protein n=1 Tax=Tateyamaria sp. ANG-S1 TaxID=1577905 RepID=UPI00057E1B48